MPSYRTTVFVSLACAAVALASVGVLAARRLSQLNDDARLVEQTQEVITQVGRVLALGVDAETGVRGFVVTGDSAFLEPYNDSRTALDRQLLALEDLVAGDTAQTARVRDLGATIRQHVIVLNDIVQRRRTAGFDDARRAVATREGKRLMDRARVIAANMGAAETAVLAERRAQSMVGFRSLRYVTWAASGSAVLAIVLAGMQIGAELGRRRRAEIAAKKAYDDVEDTVRARTKELRAAVEQLQISEAQFRVVTDLSPVHLFRTDAAGGWEFVSAGFYAFTALTEERARGFGWVEAVDAEDRGNLMNAWRAAMADGRPFEAECRFMSGAGQPRWCRVRVVPRQSEGTTSSWVGAVVDIHELKDALAMRASALARAQDARRDAEHANHLKDEFLATVSHELRTPLNAIVGWAHVLTLGEVGMRERAHAVEAIARNAKIQTRLIEDLLDVSSMMRGRLNIMMSALDLRVVLQEAVETVSPAARARQVQLDVRVDDSPVMVDGDQSRLQQIAWNLLSNAVKFTPKGGTVIVSVERAGSRVALRVQDTGEGIAPDFLDHVFEPFRQGPSTSVRTGLGLGLAIVRQLVELHGGSITAESAGKGQGSVFIVTFPLRVGDGASAVPRGRSGAPGLEGVRVLVAEDDEDSGAALEAVLRRRGCIVRLARTAAACLTMLAESPADVLLFDVGLPDDDGYSLLRRARRLTAAKPIPAIALTALAGENDRVRALAAGFRAHVPKPFDPDTIVREIIRATERDAS